MGKFVYSDDEEFYEPQAPQQKTNFQSIDKFINLPNVIPVTSKQLLFNSVDFKQGNHVKLENVQAFRQLFQQLYDSFSIYENPQNYQFKFPNSMFSEQLQEENQISYQHHLQKQEIAMFRQKMSSQQLFQIKKRGQFKTYSEESETQPYIWKINPLLFAGQQTRQKRLLSNIGAIYSMIAVTGKEVLTKIFISFLEIVKSPIDLFYILIGKKQIKILNKIDYSRQVLKDFCLEVSGKIRRNPNFNFWEYLNTFYSFEAFNSTLNSSQQIAILKRKAQDSKAILANKEQRLFEIDNHIQRQWNKRRSKEIRKVEKMITENKVPEVEAENYYTQKFKQSKFCFYLTNLQEKLKQDRMEAEKINSLIFIMRLFYTISCKTSRMNKQIKQIRQKTRQQLKNNHPFKYYDRFELQKKTNQSMESIVKSKKQQLVETLFEDPAITSLISESQFEIYQQYKTFLNEKQTKMKQKQKQIPTLSVGLMQFQITKYLLPPYRRIQTYIYSTPKIQLQTYNKIQIKSDHNGYKITLYIQRFIVYLQNYNNYVYWFMTRSIFGTKCLFQKSDFLWDERVKGKNIKQIKVRPIYLRFKSLFTEIINSRNKFEQTPDRGLFGKKGARFINIFQCYFLKLFIKGFAGFILLGSILIFLNLIICVFLIATGPIWIFIILSFRYACEIIIFYNKSYSPLCNLVLSILFKFLTIILLGGFLLILIPTAVICYLIFTIIQLAITFILDFFCYILISKFGRTPSNNSSIAWKISGPGVSQTKYLSLNADDISVLTQSQLQRALLSQIKKKTKEQINKYFVQYRNTISLLISPYTKGQPSNVNNQIYMNSNKLGSNFDKQYEKFGKRFPRRPTKVRFTEEEINIYFEKSKAIVQNFVEKNQHQQWIFDKFIVENGDYDELTRAIWILIFGCGEEIFQPLQKIDPRFTIQSKQRSKMQKNIQQVINSLQQSVNFQNINYNNSHSHPKRNFFDQDQHITLTSLININRQNQELNISLPDETIYYLFHPRYHLEQLVKVDKNNYQQAKKNQIP